MCAGKPVGYIATTRMHGFELELQWRFDPKKGAGDSGVLLRVQQPDKVWPKSVEAQLQSRSAGDIWNIGDFPMTVDKARTDGRHTTMAAPCSEKPLGEWNQYRIVLDGGNLQLFVNGVLQNTASDVGGAGTHRAAERGRAHRVPRHPHPPDCREGRHQVTDTATGLRVVRPRPRRRPLPSRWTG